MILTFMLFLIGLIVGRDVNVSAWFLLAETVSWCLVALTIKLIFFGL